jgi:PAS domain S-box-containing protein
MPPQETRRDDPGGSELLDLRWSEARWRAILETARDAIVSIDRNGRITLFNRAAEEIFGYTAAEALGASVAILMPSPFAEEHDRYIRAYEATGVKRAIGRIREVTGKRKNGELFPVELSVSEARLGEEVVYVAILRDATERRRMEEALRRERDFAERLIEAARTIVLVLDPAGRIVRFNRFFEDLAGTRLEEVRGADWFETFLPEAAREAARRFFRDHAQELPAREAAERGEVLPLRCLDGSIRDIEWHVRELRGGAGEPEGLLAVGIDVTERLRAARRLAVQYAVSRALAESASLAEAGPRLLEAIGESLGASLGELWIVDPLLERLRLVAAWYARDLNGGELAEISRDLTFGRGLGLPGWIWERGRSDFVADLARDPRISRRAILSRLGLRSAVGAPILAGGRVLGALLLFGREAPGAERETLPLLESLGSQIGAFVERTRAEEAVRSSEARFFAFMNNSPAVAFLKDEEGRYVYVNSPWERTFGKSFAEVRGKTDYDLWPAETARQLRANDRAVLAAHRTLEVYEFVPLPNGEMRQWLAFKFPIRDSAGRRYIAGMALDVTERVKAETQLREMQRLAAERARLADIGAIAAKIAHDLGNPLGALSMQTQVMLRRAQRDPGAPIGDVVAQLRQLASEVQRLEGLVRELMDFAREQRLDLQRIDPSRFLREVVELWQPLAAERGIELDLQLAEGLEPFEADPAQLRRVLDNLIKNALEAIEAPPARVTVRATNLPEAIRISVEDTGPGIPESVRLFHLFETTKPKGSGLGLAVSRQIVQAHGGDIRFEQANPHGACFHVELPRRVGAR